MLDITEVKLLERKNEEPGEMENQARRIHHRMMHHHHGMMEKISQRVIVKGYMRPDGTSYYVVIPKEIREQFQLKGGEYFIMRAMPWAKEITLKLAKFVAEEENGDQTTKTP